MKITKQQRSLLRAVRDGDLVKVKALLRAGCDPEFPAYSDTTPLLEAVYEENLPAIRALLSAGASPDQPNADGETPRDVAKYLPAVKRALKSHIVAQNRQDILFPQHLEDIAKAKRASSRFRAKSASRKNETAEPIIVKPPKPVFRAETLSDVFNAEKWAGKTKEMEKLWAQVPKNLKKTFDFAEALSEATRATLKKSLAGAPSLKKSVPKDAAPGA